MRNVSLLITCLWCLLAVLLSTPSALGREAAETGTDTKKLNVKEFILEHVGDAYEWHITTWGGRHLSIPLPVIAYTKEQGWNLFMSSKLHHGAYRGFYISHEGAHNGKLVTYNREGAEARPLDLSLTKNATAIIINCIILICIVLSVVRWYKKHPLRSVPRGFIGAVEMFIMNIHDELIKPCVGADYKRYAPYLLTAFFFILINNLMGLIPFFPGGAATTGNIAVTFVMALCTFVAVNLFGNKEYWREVLWPDVPVWMKAPLPLMPLIEVFGLFTKPFALMVRLFANILAGHAIVLGLTCLIFLTVTMGPALNAGMTAISVVMTILMSFLELLVAYIQAYVFTMLSAVFIGLSRPQHHHQPKIQPIENQI